MLSQRGFHDGCERRLRPLPCSDHVGVPVFGLRDGAECFALHILARVHLIGVRRRYKVAGLRKSNLLDILHVVKWPIWYEPSEMLRASHSNSTPAGVC
jgi:hypothetical protein